MTFRPKSPNDSSEPRHALPRILPFCCLRYLTFFGINLMKPSNQLSAQSGQRSVPVPCTLRPVRCFLKYRRAHRSLRLTPPLLVNISAIDPRLHADHAIRRARFGKAVVNIRTQRVQRQTALQIPLGTRNFVAVQTARNANLDSLAAEAQRRINRLAHRAAEADALLELQRDVLCHQLRIELRLVDFENVDKDIAVGALLQLNLELLNLGALAADDDARARGADDDPQLVARTLDLDGADASSLQLFLQLALQVHVFDEQFVIVALTEPARAPRLVNAEPKSVRMDFLSHNFLYPLLPCLFGRRFLRCRLLCRSLLGCGLLYKSLLLGRLRCSRRFRIHRLDQTILLALSHRDHDVSQAALIAIRATHRSRADTLHARAFIGNRVLHVEVVHIHVEPLFLAQVVGV